MTIIVSNLNRFKNFFLVRYVRLANALLKDGKVHETSRSCL